jgi:hypothetical protein
MIHFFRDRQALLWLPIIRLKAGALQKRRYANCNWRIAVYRIAICAIIE